MKKLLIVITALLVSTGAMAQHHGHHGYHGGGHGGGNWIGPLIGGVVLGTIITNSQRQVIVQQPPVIVQQPPIFNYPIQNYYSCLVQVQDPYSGVIRNEVRTCVNQ
jgi:hypothetical protein